MKYTSTLSGRFALLHITALTVVLFTSPSFANSIDDGTTHTNLVDTVYDEALYVGLFHPNNGLLVTSDSTLKVGTLIVGSGEDSTNNLISVVGGSRLIAGEVNTNGLATGGIVVGGTDSESAAISVDHASKLEGDYLYVGFGTNDSGAIKLAGGGTELNIAKDAYVGYAGSTNSVDIGANSLMKVGGMLTVGNSGSDNHINVSGTLSVNSTNSINVVKDTDNDIVIKNGGTLQVNGAVDTGTLEELGIVVQSRSTLELGGELTLSNNKIDGGHNIILNNGLSGETANWQSSSVTIIGDTTSYNTLTFTNGASGTAAANMLVGYASNANYNELNVGGTGSTFTATTDMAIGFSGKYNELNVADGGQVDAQDSLYLGYNTSATDNQANIGSNGVLIVTGDVLVGANGGKNTFNIDHGRVSVTNNFILGSRSINNRYIQTGGTNTVTGAFIIGRTEKATGKTTVGKTDTSGNLGSVGGGATLDIQQSLTVGQEGGGSILLIHDGGTVNVAGDAVIGEAVGDNYIFLQPDDPDTRFNIAGDLVVGKEGGNNRFAVYGGTANIDGSLYLGGSTNQHVEKNYIHMETTNAVLNVASAIYIGASNSINTLDLVDGAKVSAQDLFVGTYDGVSNNVVTVTGDDSLLSISNKLAIGSNSGSNNAVNVRNGGTLEVAQNNIEMGSGANNTLTVADQGTLKTLDWDFTAMTNTATNIVFETGSTLHLLGLLEGTNMVEGGLNFVLDGAGASWDTASNTMYVGYETDNNSLSITNGATASTLTNLYIGFASEDNVVTVGGAGSSLGIGADLFIGTETNDSSYNTLNVLDGANVMVDNDAFLYRGGVLKIDSSSQVHVAGDYKQDEFSTLEVGVSSNQVQTKLINLVVDGNAGFSTSEDPEEYSLIKVFNDGIGESNVVTIVEAKTIMVDDEIANSGSIKGNIATNLLLGFTVTLSNGVDNTYIVLDDFVKHSIGEAGDLDGQLLNVADEIDDMYNAGNSNASNMVKIIEGMSSSREIYAAFDNCFGKKQSSSPAHNVLGLGVKNVTEQLTIRGDNTRARMGAASASAHRNKPSGTAGPHQSGQELEGWFAGYGTWGSQSEADGYGGYDASIRGFLIGADASVADNILVGIAGGSGSSTIDKDNGSTTDMRTTYGSLYASLGTQSWFADASFIYGGSTIDSVLGAAFDTTAEYNAQNIAFYLGGGKEITSEYLIITPQASLLANYYKQDEYSEESSVVARTVDSFDALYIQSSIGCNLGFYAAMGEVTLKPELRAHWLHEFNGDEQSLSYSLINGDGSMHTLLLQAPEGDILKLGAGVSAKMTEYLEIRFDLDTRQTSNYSDYTALGSLRYQF